MPSARDIAFIGCRLLAVYSLYSALLSFALGLSFVSQVLAAPGRSIWQASEYAFHNGTVMLANIAAFFVLWFGAAWFAGRISPEAPETEDQAPVAEWPVRKVLTVALTLLGLWVLVHHLPPLASFIPLILEHRIVEVAGNGAFSYQTQQFITALLTIGLGIVCVLGAQGIADFIAKLRRW
jgi:hypothetical protein